MGGRLMTTHVALMLSQADPAAVGLTPAGIMIMLFSVTLVCGLNVFCLYRILREPKPSEHHHAPLDIDTGDAD